MSMIMIMTMMMMMKIMMATDRLVLAADNKESVTENDIALLQLLLVRSNLTIMMITIMMMMMIMIIMRIMT